MLNKVRNKRLETKTMKMKRKIRKNKAMIAKVYVENFSNDHKTL